MEAVAGPSRTTRPPDAESPGGGPAPCISLRTKSPLPTFTCPHPVPPASATIGATVKLTVLRLLTGQVSQSSSTAPMTESENLKLMTIHGWRMEMIALELRQNVLIAPETRDKIGDGADEAMQGFELADESDCGLLEPGDEVLIRLKPAFSLADLHLPQLPRDHIYSLPLGALTRAGTLSGPPPYSQIQIKRAAEPSSHSSSVQANPDANYEARQYRNYRRDGYRVVTLGSSNQPAAAALNNGNTAANLVGMTPAEMRRFNRGSTNPAVTGPTRPLGLGMGVDPAAAMPPAATYRPAAVKQRRSQSYIKEAALPPTPKSPKSPAIPTEPAASSPPPLPSQGAGVGPVDPGNASTAPIPPSAAVSPPASASRPVLSQAPSGTSLLDSDRTSPAQVATASTHQSFGVNTRGGQDSMPLTALVIGPGVQGAVGRGTNSGVGHAGPATAEGVAPQNGSAAEYGNAKAFAGFTAAGGEVGHRRKPQRSTSQTSPSQAYVSAFASQQQASTSKDREGSNDNGGKPPRIRSKSYDLFTSPLVERKKPSQSGSKDSKTSRRSSAADKDRKASSKSKKDKGDSRRGNTLPMIKASEPLSIPFGDDEDGEVEQDEGEDEDAVDLRDGDDLPPMPMPMPMPRPKTHESNGQPSYFDQIPSETSRGYASSPHSPERSRTMDKPLPPTERGGGTGSQTPTATDGVEDGEKPPSPSTSKSGLFARLAQPGLGLGPPKIKRENSRFSTKSKADTNASVSSPLRPDGGPQSASEPADEWEEAPESPLAADDEAEAAGIATGTASPSTHNNGNKKLSKADRRFMEVQRKLAAEVSRQGQEESRRQAEIASRRLEKEKEAKRKEEEERRKREERKWEVWDEVRRRGDEGRIRG